MKKLNSIQYILFLILGFLFFLPDVVYAKDVVTCKYEVDSGMTMYNFTLSKSGGNYSTTGRLKKYDDESQSNHFEVVNLDDWIDVFSRKDKKEMCPSYVVLMKRERKEISASGDFSLPVSKTTWEAYAFESEADAQSKSETLKSESGVSSSVDNVNIQIITTVTTKTLHSTNRSSYANARGYSDDDDFTIDLGEDISTNTCEEVLGKNVVEFIQMLFNYIKILGPILVILFSSIDFTKSILSSDEENMKKTQKRFGIRIGCAIGLYFLPLIATLLINLVFGTSGSQVCGLK